MFLFVFLYVMHFSTLLQLYQGNITLFVIPWHCDLHSASRSKLRCQIQIPNANHAVRVDSSITALSQDRSWDATSKSPMPTTQPGWIPLMQFEEKMFSFKIINLKLRCKMKIDSYPIVWSYFLQHSIGLKK